MVSAEHRLQELDFQANTRITRPVVKEAALNAPLCGKLEGPARRHVKSTYSRRTLNLKVTLFGPRGFRRSKLTTSETIGPNFCISLNPTPYASNFLNPNLKP